MNKLVDIYKSLEVDERIIKIYQSEITPPDFEFRWKPAVDFFYPFPPFFVPLFVDNGEPGYYGIVNHFFVDRRQTFAFFSLEAGFVWEEARLVEQYFADLMISMISSEEEITEDILKFTEQIDYNPTDELWNFLTSDNYNGSSLESYHNLNIFSKKIPFTYAVNEKEYDGDFPTSRVGINTNSIKNACEYEINKNIDVRKYFGECPWLDENSNKKTLFDQYFKQNDLGRAWLTLNSSGWLLDDVVEGLEKLKTKSADDLFYLVADNWIAGYKNSHIYRKKEAYTL